MKARERGEGQLSGEEDGRGLVTQCCCSSRASVPVKSQIDDPSTAAATSASVEALAQKNAGVATGQSCFGVWGQTGR